MEKQKAPANEGHVSKSGGVLGNSDYIPAVVENQSGVDLFRKIAEALTANGLVFDEIDASGEMVYCGTTKKPTSKDGRYRLHLDWPPVLWLANYHDGGVGKTIRLYDEKQIAAMTEAERMALKERIRQEREQAQICAEEAHARAKQKALAIYRSQPNATSENGYLKLKQVKPVAGLKQARDGRLVVPVYGDDWKIQSLQFITDGGQKRFLKNGKKKGGFFPIRASNKADDAPLLVAEGLATGLSCHEATGLTTLVCFDCGNLLAVAQMARREYSERTICLCGDNDTSTPGNPGLTAARRAAAAIEGHLAYPPKGDFNDWRIAQGLDAVKEVIDAAIAAGPVSPLPENENQKINKLHCVNIQEFLTMQIPKREMIIDPILQRQGLAMIHAARGCGKTFLGLYIAYCVASGGDLFDGRWRVNKPYKVLYVDGEMPAITLQERLIFIGSGCKSDITIPENFKLITPDLQKYMMPNISNPVDQIKLDAYVSDSDLIILDNLATLARSGRANEEESWRPIQDWILKLRRLNKSLIIVHHQNKNGDQRGSIAKEDILDTVISLRRPNDYSTEEGARFEVHLTKARVIAGDDAKPFEATMKIENGSLSWVTKNIDDIELEQIKEMLGQRMTVREVAEELGISKSKVGRIKRQIEAMA